MRPRPLPTRQNMGRSFLGVYPKNRKEPRFLCGEPLFSFLGLRLDGIHLADQEEIGRVGGNLWKRFPGAAQS
jgi:hypothetical protein